MKALKKIFYATGIQKKEGPTILISNDIDFKSKLVIRDDYIIIIIIIGLTYQEDITIVSIYSPNIGTSKYINKY